MALLHKIPELRASLKTRPPAGRGAMALFHKPLRQRDVHLRALLLAPRGCVGGFLVNQRITSKSPVSKSREGAAARSCRPFLGQKSRGRGPLSATRTMQKIPVFITLRSHTVNSTTESITAAAAAATAAAAAAVAAVLRPSGCRHVGRFCGGYQFGALTRSARPW